jgi:thiol:disulfide interchange protein
LFEGLVWVAVVIVGLAVAWGLPRAQAQDGDEAADESPTSEEQREKASRGPKVIFPSKHEGDVQFGDSNTESPEDCPADAANEPAIDWKEWAPDAVKDMLDKDRPVFVAFSAEWDITTKINRRTVLQQSEVRSTFDACNAAAFRADWTHGGKRIRNKLNELGFDGVPAYVVYLPESPQEPHVLSQVLSVDAVVSAIEIAGDC